MSTLASSGQPVRASRRGRKLAKLSGYVATTVGAGILATPATEAAIIPINSGFFGQLNGGQTAGGRFAQYDFAGPGSGTMYFNNMTDFIWNGLNTSGAAPGSGIASGFTNASPTKFVAGQSIGPGEYFNPFRTLTSFRAYGTDSPDFGPGSYLGFKFGANFGWVEVTWNSSTNEWYALSGAYESDPNTPILAGAAPVPEIDPSGFASVASMAIGSLAMLEQRRRKRAAKGAVTATSA